MTLERRLLVARTNNGCEGNNNKFNNDIIVDSHPSVPVFVKRTYSWAQQHVKKLQMVALRQIAPPTHKIPSYPDVPNDYWAFQGISNYQRLLPDCDEDELSIDDLDAGEDAGELDDLDAGEFEILEEEQSNPDDVGEVELEVEQPNPDEPSANDEPAVPKASRKPAAKKAKPAAKKAPKVSKKKSAAKKKPASKEESDEDLPLSSMSSRKQTKRTKSGDMSDEDAPLAAMATSKKKREKREHKRRSLNTQTNDRTKRAQARKGV